MISDAAILALAIALALIGLTLIFVVIAGPLIKHRAEVKTQMTLAEIAADMKRDANIRENSRRAEYRERFDRVTASRVAEAESGLSRPTLAITPRDD